MDKEELLSKVCDKLHKAGLGFNVHSIVPTTYDILKKAGCLKEEIKLPVVKTGVLMSAKELVVGATQMFISGFGTILNHTGQERVNVIKGFEHLYKDIKEEVDYSQIPVGSIVELMHNGECNTIAYWPVEYKFKSLKIVRWGLNG